MWVQHRQVVRTKQVVQQQQQQQQRLSLPVGRACWAAAVGRRGGGRSMHGAACTAAVPQHTLCLSVSVPPPLFLSSGHHLPDGWPQADSRSILCKVSVCQQRRPAMLPAAAAVGRDGTCGFTPLTFTPAADPPPHVSLCVCCRLLCVSPPPAPLQCVCCGAQCVGCAVPGPVPGCSSHEPQDGTDDCKCDHVGLHAGGGLLRAGE